MVTIWYNGTWSEKPEIWELSQSHLKQEIPSGKITALIDPELGCVTAALYFSDDSIQMLEADVVFGTVTASSPAKSGTGFNDAVINQL